MEDRSAAEGVGLVRALNEQRVLDTVFSNGPISRAGIARATGLSKPTVSSVVGELEDAGLLFPDGESSGGVGRPAVLYRVDATAGYVYAADVGGTKIRGGIADLFGEIVTEAAIPTPSDAPGPSLVREVADLLHGLATDAAVDRDQIRAGGIGVPAIVDLAADRASGAYNLRGLETLAITEAFSDELGLPVQVDNDVNLAAVGERWRGLAADYDSFVAISIGTGVGMGVVIDGEIFRGTQGAAGEIDFLPIGPDPSEWRRQGHGSFESQVAAPAILRKFRRRHGEGIPTDLSVDTTVPAIFAAAEAGDELATAVLDEEARQIALAVTAVTAVVDPAVVVLGGGVGSNRILCDAVENQVDQLTPRAPRIAVSALGTRGAFIGSIAVGLRLMRSRLLADVVAAR